MFLGAVVLGICVGLFLVLKWSRLYSKLESCSHSICSTLSMNTCLLASYELLSKHTSCGSENMKGMHRAGEELAAVIILVGSIRAQAFISPSIVRQSAT